MLTRSAQGPDLDAREFGVSAGSTSDQAPAITAALAAAAGRIVRLPAGILRIASRVDYAPAVSGPAWAPGVRLAGAGQHLTFLDSRVTTAGHAALRLKGPGGGDFAVGCHLSDFTVMSADASTVQHGIELQALWWSRLERITINGSAGKLLDGLRILNAESDLDSTSYLSLAQVNIRECRGWGWAMPDPPSGEAGACGGLHAVGCTFQANNTAATAGVGGVQLRAVRSRLVQCGIAYNRGVGLRVPTKEYSPGPPSINTGTGEDVVLDGCEFDTNENYHVDLEGGRGFRMENCKLLCDNGVGANGVPDDQPATLVRLGQAALAHTTVSYPLIRRNRVTITTGGGTYTGVAVANTCLDARIEDNEYVTSGITLTKVSDSGTRTVTRDIGVTLPLDFRAPVTASLTATGQTANIDAAASDRHRVVISGGLGAITGTIVNPINPRAGQLLYILVITFTGTTPTLTWGTTYRPIGGNTWTGIPASNKVRGATFMYDSGLGTWSQLGDADVAQ